MASETEQSWKIAIALCDELAAMERMGIPFESGTLGGDLFRSHQYREISQNLSSEMQRGMSLTEAIETQKENLPSMFHAVVKAGMKSNNLSGALEGISLFAKKLLQIRSNISLSMVYPLIVVCFTFVMTLLMTWWIAPKYMKTYQEFGVSSSKLYETLASMSQNISYWAWGVPVTFIVLMLMFYFFSNRSLSKIVPSYLSWFPGVRQTADDYEYSLFSEVFSLCLEHQIPLDEAFMLAAQASGNKNFVGQSSAVALRLSQGETFENCFSSGAFNMFPKYMRWMMTVGQKHQVLSSSMKQMGQVYFQKATSRASWIERIIPLFLMVVVAGGAVLAYALLYFGPMIEILQELLSQS